MILAGNIGATHTRLALFDGDPHEPLALTLYPITARGRLRTMLKQIPVHVILNERAGLLGAARIARHEPPHIHRTELTR